MHIKILRLTIFVLSILAVALIVIGCSNEIDPMKKQPASPAPTAQQVTASQVVTQVATRTTEKKKVRLTDKTGTPFDKMSDSQIAQMKRRDCRFREEIIPHDYKK
ncbi:MAG: hypothetical protein WBM35_05740 [Candidatus Electrothrix sp.]